MPAKKTEAKTKPGAKQGRKPGTPMSDDHKAALAAGREASRTLKTPRGVQVAVVHGPPPQRTWTGPAKP